jgi:L-alanine-DL-glutamate epimerase-like enolase superfamily enzyme
MQVTAVELLRSEDPIDLPEPWLPAWRAPGGDPDTTFEWSLTRVHTDEGVVGLGPGTGVPEVDVSDLHPFRAGALWEDALSGARAGTAGRNAAGLEIALWDAAGKATGRPIRDLLGGVRERVPVYAATSRLMDPEDLAAQVRDVRDAGFPTAKVRLHRPDPEADLAAVRAVREAVGSDYSLFVDANQNNDSPGYDFWSRRTARRMARDLDDLGVDLIEEPLPRRDVEGLARIAESVDASLAGGEHAATPRDYRPHLREAAYDVLQPDVLLGGNMGIGGLYRTAAVADFFDRPVVPHVCGNGTLALGLAATLQVAGAATNVPMVEFPHDPPIITRETGQRLVEEPIWIDDEGTVAVPDGPGLGVDVNEEEIEANGEVVWRAEA